MGVKHVTNPENHENQDFGFARGQNENRLMKSIGIYTRSLWNLPAFTVVISYKQAGRNPQNLNPAFSLYDPNRGPPNMNRYMATK